MAATYRLDRPQLPLQENRVVDVEAWICTAPETLDNYLYAELCTRSLVQEGQLISYPGRIALYVNLPRSSIEKDPVPPLHYGEVIRFRGYLEEPTYHAIPGVPDFRQVLWSQGILHVVHLKSALQIQHPGDASVSPSLAALFRYTQSFAAFADHYMSREGKQLVLSALLGRKRTLKEGEKALIKRLGVFHLFVVSGFHVSVVVLLLHWALSGLGRLGRIITLLGLWLYVLTAGSTVPALRAGLMTTLFYLLLNSGLSRRFLNTVGISALVLLVIQPGSLFSAGFQFSYLCLCVIGLLVLPCNPLFQGLLSGFKDVFSATLVTRRDRSSRLRRRVRFLLEDRFQFWPRRPVCLVLPWAGRVATYLVSLLLCSGLIQLATLPLSLHYNNRWIWTQLLSNLVLVPIFAFFIPVSFVLLLTFWLPTGPFLVGLVDSLARGLLWLMERLADWSYVSYLPHPNSTEMAAYFVLFAAPLLLLAPKRKVCAVLGPCFLWLAVQQPQDHAQGTLEVTMLDVGQGESIHIRYPDGSDALIDTGGLFLPEQKDGNFVGERLLARYLWELRSEKLNYVLLTHPHIDHIQGYNFISQVFPIERLYFHDVPDIRPVIPTADRLSRGSKFSSAGVEHLVLHPPGGLPTNNKWNLNNRSLVVQLRYRKFTMLFTGDIERTAEQHLDSLLETVTVLKAAHHGGRDSNTAQLLERTRPQLVLISAGRRNAFGHPSAATVKRLRKMGIPYLTTGDWGSLRITTDGSSWRTLHYSVKEKQFRPVG